VIQRPHPVLHRMAASSWLEHFERSSSRGMPTNYSPSYKPMLKQIYILAGIFLWFFVVGYIATLLAKPCAVLLGIQ
jgi:hypothetical protein